MGIKLSAHVTAINQQLVEAAMCRGVQVALLFECGSKSITGCKCRKSQALAHTIARMGRS